MKALVKKIRPSQAQFGQNKGFGQKVKYNSLGWISTWRLFFSKKIKHIAHEGFCPKK